MEISEILPFIAGLESFLVAGGLVAWISKQPAGTKEMTEGRRTSAYKYYGVSYLQHSLVFINVRKIPDEKVLENTIVHELIHMRFPYLAHGKRFNKLVRQGLRGKSFLPYRKRSKANAI